MRKEQEEDDDLIDGQPEEDSQDFADEESAEEELEGEAQEGENPSDDAYTEDLGDDFYDEGMGGAPPIEKYKDLLQSLTNFDPYLKQTINNWLGLYWDEKKKDWEQEPDVKPLCNVYCATWAIGFLRTYVRNNNIITDIGNDEYINLMDKIIENLWLNIGTRADEFGITCNGDILRICNELEHSACLILMGAGDGKYNKFLSTVSSRHETIHGQNMPQMPPGMMPQQNMNMWEKFSKAMLGGG